MSAKKMGRPTQSPKTNQLRIRMSDEDMNILNTLATTVLNQVNIMQNIIHFL